MKNLAAIILAAGKGTRMKSNLPKVLHPVAGNPMLYYPVRLLKEFKAKKVILVVGHGAELVREAFSREAVGFAVQKEQLGTGHAVMCAVKGIRNFDGDILILSGDVPLISKGTVNALIRVHGRGGRKKPVVSLITAILDDPAGYGRVMRDENGAVARIIEDRDCNPLQKKIREINTGLYLISSRFLFTNIRRLGKENAQGEYYLPDLIQMARSQGGKVSALTHLDANEVMGINNRVELARANGLMRERIANGHMLSGVSIIDPANTYIDYGVSIGADTVIYPGVHLMKGAVIGSNCVIEEGVRVEGSTIGDNSVIKSHSVVESTRAGRGVCIGPFARLRPGNVISDGVRIGNFVEVKKTSMGRGTKANHLSYLGDSVIGEDVNIGAGVITCNYDGVSKHRTTIEDGAFIGSDSQLIAPVKVGKGAYVGSGTTVTKDVPPGSLVISRARERVVEGWAGKRNKKG